MERELAALGVIPVAKETLCAAKSKAEILPPWKPAFKDEQPPF